MIDLLEIREDPEKQRGGTAIYLEEGFVDDPGCFYVRRWGTPESQKAIKEIRLELFGPTHRHQEIDESLLIAHWLCEYGVSGWSNICNGKTPLKYSKSEARKVFLNPEHFLRLNALLISAAQDFRNYEYDRAEEDLEALKKP